MACTGKRVQQKPCAEDPGGKVPFLIFDLFQEHAQRRLTFLPGQEIEGQGKSLACLAHGFDPAGIPSLELLPVGRLDRIRQAIITGLILGPPEESCQPGQQPGALEIKRSNHFGSGRRLESFMVAASTFSDGIFLAGSCHSPKDIPDTVGHAGAAAAEALALADKGTFELEPITAIIDEDLCSGCQMCVNLCPFTAITYDKEKGISEINDALCKGCGTCVSACPSGASQQQHFRDEQIFAEIEGIFIE